MHRVTIKPLIAGKCDVRNHVKGGGDHLVEKVVRAFALCLETCTTPQCCITHYRAEIKHIAVGKYRCSSAALPAPMGPFRDKERLSNCRF